MTMRFKKKIWKLSVMIMLSLIGITACGSNETENTNIANTPAVSPGQLDDFVEDQDETIAGTPLGTGITATGQRKNNIAFKNNAAYTRLSGNSGFEIYLPNTYSSKTVGSTQFWVDDTNNYIFIIKEQVVTPEDSPSKLSMAVKLLDKTMAMGINYDIFAKWGNFTISRTEVAAEELSTGGLRFIRSKGYLDISVGTRMPYEACYSFVENADGNNTPLLLMLIDKSDEGTNSITDAYDKIIETFTLTD